MREKGRKSLKISTLRLRINFYLSTSTILRALWIKLLKHVIERGQNNHGKNIQSKDEVLTK